MSSFLRRDAAQKPLNIESQQLNLVYNASDVGLNTSTGEGWGFCNFEHAAAGKTQVVPRVGALAEIWDGCAEFVEPAQDLVYEGILTEGKLVNPDSVAATLEALYTNREHRRLVTEACYRRVSRNDPQWGKIAQECHEVFQEGLSESTKNSDILGDGQEVLLIFGPIAFVYLDLSSAPPEILEPWFV